MVLVTTLGSWGKPVPRGHSFTDHENDDDDDDDSDDVTMDGLLMVVVLVVVVVVVCAGGVFHWAGPVPIRSRGGGSVYQGTPQPPHSEGVLQPDVGHVQIRERAEEAPPGFKSAADQ
jgi:hypothetical protein